MIAAVIAACIWCGALASLAWRYPAVSLPNLRQAADADLILAVADVDFAAGTATALQAWPQARAGSWERKTVHISNLGAVRESWPKTARVLVPVNFDAQDWRITAVPPGSDEEPSANRRFAVYADTPFNRSRLAPWISQ